MKAIAVFFSMFIFFNSFGQSDSEFSNKELIIKVKNLDFNVSKVDLSQNKIGISVLDDLNIQNNISKIKAIGQFKITRTFLLKFQNPIDIEVAKVRYKNLGVLDYVEPNYIAYSGGKSSEESLIIFPNDTGFNKQWGLYNPGTQAGIGNVTEDADVDMELAWDIQTGDPNLIIAVSDSGLKMNHPDIAARIWIKSTEIANNSIDDDNNGLIDDINGWDWVNNDNIPNDDHGHGSNVTGIIGCIANNNSLFAGANWNSKIMPLKVLNSSNSGTYEAMASSIFYAVDNGAKIISMSIGGGSESALLYDALNYTNANNVLFVVCMMNFNNNTTYYPAGYATAFPNVIAVGATNPDDTRTAPFFWSSTSGSSYGSHIKVVAPGNFIYGLHNISNTISNSYWGGTSQATPLVAGIASLMLSQNPSLTPNQIRTIIETTAEDQVGNPLEDVAGFDNYMGYGRVNAYAALQSTLGLSEVKDQAQEFQIINPTQSSVLELNSKGKYIGAYTLSVYSIDGKLIENKSIKINSGVNRIPFKFPAGHYIMDLKSDAYSKVFKVVVE